MCVRLFYIILRCPVFFPYFFSLCSNFVNFYWLTFKFSDFLSFVNSTDQSICSLIILLISSTFAWLFPSILACNFLVSTEFFFLILHCSSFPLELVTSGITWGDQIQSLIHHWSNSVSFYKHLRFGAKLFLPQYLLCGGWVLGKLWTWVCLDFCCSCCKAVRWNFLMELPLCVYVVTLNYVPQVSWALFIFLYFFHLCFSDWTV